jgi:hypothetical protein
LTWFAGAISLAALAAQAMTEAVEYRQFADECLKAVWLARVPEIRTLLLSMAKRWIELAEQAERKNSEPAEHKKPPAPSISRRARARQAS